MIHRSFTAALFMGSPVSLVLPALLVPHVPTVLALVVGAAAGMAAGLAVIKALKHGR